MVILSSKPNLWPRIMGWLACVRCQEPEYLILQHDVKCGTKNVRSLRGGSRCQGSEEECRFVLTPVGFLRFPRTHRGVQFPSALRGGGRWRSVS